MSLNDPASTACTALGADAPGSVDSEVVEMQLPAGAVAPAKARAVIAAAASHLPAAVVDRAKLAASELVTNAVRHGSNPGAPLWIRVVIAATGVRLEVIDRGRTEALSPDSAGGFGLGIVRSVADSVQYFREPAWRVVADFCAG